MSIPAVRDVDVPALSLSRLEPVIGAERHRRLVEAGEIGRGNLDGRTVWNVNSTVSGGGVAEMLQVLVGYARGAGLDVRWAVIGGDPDFFAVTKRMHNRFHGTRGDGGELGPDEAATYEAVTAANAGGLLERVRPDDVVLLHDPQTAGLCAALASAGAHVVWRSHIGADVPNEWTEQAWGFLRPHLEAAHAYVFSRQAYVPDWLPSDRVAVIPPSIDPMAPKNQPLKASVVRAILGRVGLLDGVDGSTEFERRDGTTASVSHAGELVSLGPPWPEAPLVVQVSRWDRLKDMQGVMEGFAEHVAGSVDAHLALVGPSVAGVTDDPEGAEVLQQCIDAWEALPSSTQSRVHLVTLPMDDVDENAAMVNAVQRHARVIVQKSLAEGFGLTVAEGMWKGHPVVASAVGGIVDQVADGTGVLLSDPADLDAFGRALADLLSDPPRVDEMGERARRHVAEHFAGDRHLLRYAALIEKLLPGT